MRITLSFLSLFALSSEALADVCFYPPTRVQNAKGKTIAMCGPTDMKHCRRYVAKPPRKARANSRYRLMIFAGPSEMDQLG
jgi:hypothetical protein